MPDVTLVILTLPAFPCISMYTNWPQGVTRNKSRYSRECGSKMGEVGMQIVIVAGLQNVMAYVQCLCREGISADRKTSTTSYLRPLIQLSVNLGVTCFPQHPGGKGRRWLGVTHNCLPRLFDFIERTSGTTKTCFNLWNGDAVVDKVENLDFVRQWQADTSGLGWHRACGDCKSFVIVTMYSAKKMRQ